MLGTEQRIFLVADDALAHGLEGKLDAEYAIVPSSAFEPQALVAHMAAGGDCVWIGPPDKLPSELWLGAFSCGAAPHEIRTAGDTPLPLDTYTFSKARAYGAYIRPPQEFPKHNIDEEARAELLPILTAYDRFGQPAGYPGVLMSYYAPSLVGKRFGGSQFYGFFFDAPAEAMEPAAWLSLLQSIGHRHTSGLQAGPFTAEYATVHAGERASVRLRVHNRRTASAAFEVHVLQRAPGGTQWIPIQTMRRVADGGGSIEAVCDFPIAGQEGLHDVRAEIWQDVTAQSGKPQLIDSRETGFIVVGNVIDTPNPMSWRERISTLTARTLSM